MPHDLMDLLQRAVDAAPPESHTPGEITRLAVRRQRRRTALVAGGAALALVAVGGIAVALRPADTDSKPAPVSPYLFDRTVDASQAVPAASLASYEEETWGVLSVITPPEPYLAPYATYRDIDADGHLAVVEARAATTDPLKVRILDGSGHPIDLKVPDPVDVEGSTQPAGWLPSFTDDGRLVWTASGALGIQVNLGVHVTDLHGGDDTFVGRPSTGGQIDGLSGDRLWLDEVEGGSIANAGPNNPPTHTLRTMTPDGHVSTIAKHVVDQVVSTGRAAWVTDDGTIWTMSAAEDQPVRVDVPFTSGCRLTPSVGIVEPDQIAVSNDLVAVTERCGKASDEALVVDPQGHLVVHVTGMGAYHLSLSDDELVFLGITDNGTQHTYRYGLADGVLARLDNGGKATVNQRPIAAGGRVLWYDGNGGHVGRFTD